MPVRDCAPPGPPCQGPCVCVRGLYPSLYAAAADEHAVRQAAASPQIWRSLHGSQAAANGRQVARRDVERVEQARRVPPGWCVYA